MTLSLNSENYVIDSDSDTVFPLLNGAAFIRG